MEFKLGSVVRHGVGGPESGAISLIYEFLLEEFEQDYYKKISINQIGEDLEEFVERRSNNSIHVNIRYPVYDDFEIKSVEERNKIRLDVIHTALLRIAIEDKKLDVEKLGMIRSKVLEQQFNFSFVLKEYPSKRYPGLLAKIIINPMPDKFDYYVTIEENSKERCKLKLYSALTNIFYMPYYFKFGRWKSNNEIVFSGTQKEVEIQVLVEQGKVEYINLTSYNNPPFFTFLRKDISEKERELAGRDYDDSLDPDFRAKADELNKKINKELGRE